ncbi:hypothetical protein ACC691_36575, partial [Rhizobium johnstonii]|uniref:DUF7657 domain-containing protein n=1 Tax=Rhizobium johnstonii TaxID=3019933 RepID=UPI003F97EA82
LGMTGVIWMLRERRLWVRVLWATAVGYVAVTMAMGLYQPFILPGVIVFLFFSVGYLLRVRPWAEGGARSAFRRLAPLLVAGGAAIAVVAAYALTRWSTFTAVQSTLYPGQRFDSTGSVRARDPLLLGFTGAPWNG